MAESSSPSISWVGTWFEGNPSTQFFVDVNNDNGYFRADLFSIGRKKKKKEKKNYLFSIERFSDARCMPSLTDEQIWGNLNREIRGILLIIGRILEESSFIYIFITIVYLLGEKQMFKFFPLIMISPRVIVFSRI